MGHILDIHRADDKVRTWSWKSRAESQGGTKVVCWGDKAFEMEVWGRVPRN